MKALLTFAALLLFAFPIGLGAAEGDHLDELVGVWRFKSSTKHYSRNLQADYFFGEKDELRFYSEPGMNGSHGLTFHAEQRKCSIGHLYLIWAEKDERGLVFNFGCYIEPIVFIGTLQGKDLNFEFVSHGETRIEYHFERISDAPGIRPENAR